MCRGVRMRESLGERSALSRCYSERSVQPCRIALGSVSRCKRTSTLAAQIMDHAILNITAVETWRKRWDIHANNRTTRTTTTLPPPSRKL